MADRDATHRQEFGRRLYEARLARGAARKKELKQTEVARLIGVKPNTVSRWEAGAKEPTLATIEQLATVLGVDPGDLAFGSRDERAAREAAELDARVAEQMRAEEGARLERERREREQGEQAEQAKRRRVAGGGRRR